MAQVEPPLVAVLAAGSAARFGGGKLDADCAGKPLGQWALEAAQDAGFAPGVLIVGSPQPAFARANAGWTIVTNARAQEGLGTSLALAARCALERDRRLLVMLADMPLIAPSHLSALAACTTSAATLYPGDKPGVPALLSHDVLGDVVRLKGDDGAASLLRTLPDLQLLQAPDGSLRDVDTPQGLADIAQVLKVQIKPPA